MSVGYVLDTNVISYAMRRRPEVLARLEAAMGSNAVLRLCPVVHYEILRGLLRTGNPIQRQSYDDLLAVMLWDDLRLRDWEAAAGLWHRSMALGRPVGDADLLLAAFAVNREAVLVTNNSRHFAHLDIPLVDWAS